MSEKTRLVSRFAWAERAAIVLAVVGVFGTWRSSDPVSLDGFQGPAQRLDGELFGLIALAGVGAAARGSWLGSSSSSAAAR